MPAPTVVAPVVPDRAVLPDALLLIALFEGVVTAPALPPVDPGVERVIALVPLPVPLVPVTEPAAPTPVLVPPGRVLTEPVPAVVAPSDVPPPAVELLMPELPEIGAWPVVLVAPAPVVPVAPTAAPAPPPLAVCAIALVERSSAPITTALFGLIIIPILYANMG